MESNHVAKSRGSADRALSMSVKMADARFVMELTPSLASSPTTPRQSQLQVPRWSLLHHQLASLPLLPLLAQRTPPSEAPNFTPSKAPSCAAGICNDYFNSQVMEGQLWSDSIGNTCADYAVNPDVMCPTLGNALNFGLAATDVCCACMGGEVASERCYRNCEVVVILELCDENEAGTMDFPVATLRDGSGNEVSVVLDPADAENPSESLQAGERYTWRVNTGMFESYYNDITITPTGGDEFCVAQMFVNYREESPEEPYWMEDFCGGTNNVCNTNEYLSGGQIFDTCPSKVWRH
eukprot:UN01339